MGDQYVCSQIHSYYFQRNNIPEKGLFLVWHQIASGGETSSGLCEVIPSLPLLSGPLRPGVVVFVWAPSMAQRDLFADYSYQQKIKKLHENFNIEVQCFSLLSMK